MESHFNTSLTLKNSIIAIGAFDGVHLGHQAVIKAIVERSKLLKVPAIVYTFDPPPRVYFHGVHHLTSIHEKLAKLEMLGVQHVIVDSFDKAYSNRSAYEFIDDLMKLNPMEILVGQDFRFGYGRYGDIQLLRQYFTVRIAESVCCSNGARISSTRIRALISKGDLQLSQSLLGWPIVK
ncbi:FAD synthetase [Bacillus salitolerans]|uniref:FAD synthase n=1 Tax=Bacillus salitolerans TaxID=1437434 RepID=A0ABW4LRD7_9BACI